MYVLMYGAPSYRYTSTDISGSFRINGLSEGIYELGGYIQGYQEIELHNITVKKNETSEIPTITMSLRPECFNLYDRNRVFTESETVFLTYNAFRVKKFSLSVVKIDIEKEIEKLPKDTFIKTSGDYLRQSVRYFEIDETLAVYKKDFEIKYPSPLSDIYDKKIDIGRLPLGVYVAVIRPENLPEQRHLFTVTDLAVVSKTGEGMKTTLYACDINTGMPLEKVSLTFFNHNLTAAGKGLTSKDGLFETTARYYMLIAKHESSIAFLSGNYYNSSEEEGINTYLYTDRPVYMPGQTVYFKGVSREKKGGLYQITKVSKATIYVSDPIGNNFYKTTLDISPTGSFHGSFVLPEEATLGVYHISYASKNSGQFKVLEYRKPEYSVKVTTEKNTYLPKEKISTTIYAQYYFGAPVKNAKVVYSVYQKGVSSSYYGWDDYEYEEEDYRWGYGMQVLAGETTTDEKGQAFIEIPLKDAYANETIYTIEAQVTDISRRQVTARGKVTVVPGTFKIGIMTEKHIYNPGEEITATLHLTDYNNKPVSNKTLEISAGVESYKDSKFSLSDFFRTSVVTDAEGRVAVKINVTKAGTIRIYAQAQDEFNNLITKNIYIWVPQRDYATSWAGRKQIEIVTDKSNYRVGDTVKILINSAVADMPLLVGIERSKVYSQQVVRPEGSNTDLITFKIEEEHIPNLYITVTGIHDKKYYTASKLINIAPEKHLLDIEITSDREKYQPGEKVQYKITTKDFSGTPVPTEISFGLVDESIYAISSELVPKIEDFFYGRKPHTVNSSYSFYEWLYAGAGKDGLDDSIRRDFKDTAYWNPVIITDSQGTVNLDITIPDNLTTWRATVRGATEQTLVGTAVHKIVSSKPLVARLITPRFFVEDDRLYITGIVHNYTEQDMPLQVELSASGLEILDAHQKRGFVVAGRDIKFDWKVKVKDTEKAVITLKASSEKVTDAMELTLPVLTYGQEIFKSKSGEVYVTSSDNFSIDSTALPHTIKLETYIYPSLASGLFRNLNYLADYPYGCVEQTLNRFVPLVYVAHSLKSLGIEDLSFLANDAEVFQKMLMNMPDMVKTGLSRIYASQNPDGGWGWWSQDTSRPYLSAYVVYGLTSAQKAGYYIDEKRLERAKNFLKGILKEVSDPDERTYILFALTFAGTFQKNEVEELYKNTYGINSYSLSLLTLIYAGQNDKTKAGALLEKLYEQKSDIAGKMFFWTTEKPGWYRWTNSNIEATAWALRATIAVDPQRKEIPGIIRYLLWREKAGFWRSTKDTAVCVLAFTDFLKVIDELSPDYRVILEVNDRKVSEARITKETLKEFSVATQTPIAFLIPGSENKVSLSKEGKGSAYYTHNLRYTTRDAFIEPKNEGFGVTREYFRVIKEQDKQGVSREKYEKLEENTVRVGDIIMVKITVSGREEYEYIMIEDMLPAGCEVVDESENYGWYIRREVRDEKVVFFNPIFGKALQETTYYMRAETPGRYHILPTKASMMYLPEICGQSSENFLTITEK